MNDITKILLGTAAGVVLGKTALKETKIPGLDGVKTRGKSKGINKKTGRLKKGYRYNKRGQAVKAKK